MAPFVFLLLALVIQLALDANSRRCVQLLAGLHAQQHSPQAQQLPANSLPASQTTAQLL
jgi:hypothetical protein